MSLFITFEGIEGSGKSTQAKRLYEWLISQGYDCVFTMEPGGTQISKKIRAILLDNENTGLCDIAELFLYLADRAQDVEEVIKPALLNNKIVVADRFIDSTIAYQGGGRGLTNLTILNNLATQSISPNLTILIDITAETGFHRLKHRDRIELEGADFYHRVRAEYLKIASANPDRIKVVNGSLPPDEIENEIRKLVEPLLKEKR